MIYVDILVVDICNVVMYTYIMYTLECIYQNVKVVS